MNFSPSHTQADKACRDFLFPICSIFEKALTFPCHYSHFTRHRGSLLCMSLQQHPAESNCNEIGNIKPNIWTCLLGAGWSLLVLCPHHSLWCSWRGLKPQWTEPYWWEKRWRKGKGRELFFIYHLCMNVNAQFKKKITNTVFLLLWFLNKRIKTDWSKMKIWKENKNAHLCYISESVSAWLCNNTGGMRTQAAWKKQKSGGKADRWVEGVAQNGGSSSFPVCLCVLSVCEVGIRNSGEFAPKQRTVPVDWSGTWWSEWSGGGRRRGQKPSERKETTNYLSQTDKPFGVAGFHGDDMGAVVGTLTMQTKQRRPSRGRLCQLEEMEKSSRDLRTL